MMYRKVKLSFRLDYPLYIHIAKTAKVLNWTLSEALRYLIATSYILLRPDITVNSEELIKFIKRNSKDNEIKVVDVINFISPKALKKIEELEKKLSEQSHTDFSE